jgi:hypothetical protein
VSRPASTPPHVTNSDNGPTYSGHDGATASGRVGQVLTALVAAFLLFDAVGHLFKVSQVVSASRALGFDPDVMPVVGAIELVCLIVYLAPRTAVLGAVLLTGYLGGAISAQLRIEAPLLSTTLFPLYLGIVVWVTVYLRDRRVRALVTGIDRVG